MKNLNPLKSFKTDMGHYTIQEVPLTYVYIFLMYKSFQKPSVVCWLVLSLMTLSNRHLCLKLSIVGTMNLML